MRAAFMGVAGLILLAGCSAQDEARPEPASAVPPAGDQATCGADKVASYLGVKVTDEVTAKIKSASGAQTLRVVGPHDMMTRDYRIDRLTIETDEAGVIKRLRCV